jgi:hypothetical protein
LGYLSTGFSDEPLLFAGTLLATTTPQLSSPGKSAKRVFALDDRATQYSAAPELNRTAAAYRVPSFRRDDDLECGLIPNYFPPSLSSIPRFSAVRAASRCSGVMWVATMRSAVASTAASSVKPSTGSMSGTKSNGRMK